MDFKDRAALEESVSDNGTVTLRWEKAPAAAIELQQSSDEDFGDPVTRYQGTDPGSVITGLPEGVHYFRIRETASGEWSQALAMRVEFFPRAKLWAILSLGAAVVLATIATILAGHLKHRKEADG